MRVLITGFLLFVFLPIATLEGVRYGTDGDPERYAESIEYLLEVYQSQPGVLGFGLAFLAASRDPIFHIVNVVIADWTNGINTTAFNISLLSAFLVISSFMLISSSVSKAAVRFMFFAGNTVGFLVTFNLYRSAFGLFVLCLIYRALKGVLKSASLPIPIGSAVASLFHSLYSMLFLASLMRKKKLWVYPLLALLAIALYNMIDFGAYVSSAESRSAEETAPRFPFALGMYLVLGLFVWRKRAKLRTNDFFAPTLLVGGLLPLLVLMNYSLVYERALLIYVFGLSILLSEVMRPYTLAAFGFLLLLFNIYSLTGFAGLLGIA